MQQTNVALHKLTNGGSDLCATNVCVFAFLVSLHSKGSSGSLLSEFSCICVCVCMYVVVGVGGSPR